MINMFLKSDSDATYCSEVEEMLTACNTTINKCSINLPLRRSQRLSQKFKKAFEEFKDIAQDPVPVWNGVPLDLSHKSKESTVQTSRLEIDKAIYRKNCLGVVVKDKETPKTRRNAKGNSYSNQSQQQHKYISAKKVAETRDKCYKKQCVNNRAKKVSNSRCIFPQNNALDLAIMPKLGFLRNNKLDGSEYSSNKVACTKKPGPRQTNKKALAKPAASMATTESFEDIKLSEALKERPIEMNLCEKHASNINTYKRGQKRKYTNTKSNKKQNAPNNHIKESVETNDKTPNFGAQLNVKNSCQKKTEQNNKKSNKGKIIYTTSSEIKFNRVLRSQTEIIKKILCEQVTPDTNKMKTEKLSEQSYKEGICANNTCLRKMPPAVAKTEVKHENQSHKKMPKEPDLTQNALNSLQHTKLTTEICQSDIETKNSILNKSYIKSFDKNQFLDKIRDARSYVDNLSCENNKLRKINIFEIPPSPAETSEELLKNTILYNAYPAHFKHQLPPEAILTRSLDPQPLPTPDDTIASELLESSSSSPSLPESLCELFKTRDIKDILNMKQISYHLNSYHIQALALILNLQIEYLLKMLDKVVNTSPDVLKNIEKAVKTPFTPDNDLFPNLSDELWDSSNVVPNSQSPKQRKISCLTKSQNPCHATATLRRTERQSLELPLMFHELLGGLSDIQLLDVNNQT